MNSQTPISIDIEKKEIEFVLHVPIDSTEKEVREALKNWTDEPHPRFILNPLTQLPDQNIKAILSSIEKKEEEILKNASQKMEDMDMMIGAAGLLLHWKQTELLNATNSTLTFKGLNYKKEMVWEGFEMSVDSKIQIFDKLFSPQKDNHDTMEACVSISKAKSNFKKVS